MPDPIAQALSILKRRAATLSEEARRVNEAIAALEATQPPRPALDANRPSVRTMALDLMNEADRDWSSAEIQDEYRRRGTPVHGKDPSNALRAALADAKKKGMIVSTAVGRYKAQRWVVPESSELPPDPRPTNGRIDHLLGRTQPAPAPTYEYGEEPF